ncbi:MAG: 3'(2'),5'-bisphosphate nucleotidase [Acidobacteriota bacterium]|nr:3'(2'),5'-bisphosphate nucleotidase [Acidobacteriota bacterium]MDQ7086455.1 3'(2'),5'-bisphosphate nucleotidase [Acidobacteriota bacterium]
MENLPFRTRAAAARHAVAALRRAARICRSVGADLERTGARAKDDRSPVTLADYASQAVICATLAEVFPADAVVAEESSRALREASASSLTGRLVDLVAGEMGAGTGLDRVLAWIDHGDGRAVSPGRFWTLDPIDGTKGFLRGGHYAIALGLIEDGRVVFGALACPRLDGATGEGVLLLASRGEGAFELPLFDEGPPRPVSVSSCRVPAEARLCESVERAHSHHDHAARVARAMGLGGPSVRLDSQAKYAAVARGDAEIYLRLPTRADYRERIWDHAAGMLVVEEAGGRVSDVAGRPLDFGRGRTLDGNRGVVATCGAFHDALIETLVRVLDA